MADDHAGSIEGALKGMDRAGIGLETQVQNVRAHVQNALSMAAVTPELRAAGDRLVHLAVDYGRRYDVLRIHSDQAERTRNEQRLEGMRKAYQEFRRLIQAAEPSSMARALGD